MKARRERQAARRRTDAVRAAFDKAPRAKAAKIGETLRCSTSGSR